jgi:DNA-binding XRE family transcriptional regulator
LLFISIITFFFVTYSPWSYSQHGNIMHYMNDNIKFDPKRYFGKQLKSIRQSRGISQEFLALAAGLDRTYISGCERGVRNIGLENIYKIAHALNISPGVFFMDAKS